MGHCVENGIRIFVLVNAHWKIRRRLAMPASESTATPVTDRCPLCDAPLEPGVTECSRCDWVLGYRRRKDAGNIEGRDLAAACLSIIPGAGHLYKGHTVAGWLFMGGTLLAVF